MSDYLCLSEAISIALMELEYEGLKLIENNNFSTENIELLEACMFKKTMKHYETIRTHVFSYDYQLAEKLLFEIRLRNKNNTSILTLSDRLSWWKEDTLWSMIDWSSKLTM